MSDLGHLNIEILVEIGRIVLRRALDPDQKDFHQLEALEWLDALYEVAKIGCSVGEDAGAREPLETAMNNMLRRKGE